MQTRLRHRLSIIPVFFLSAVFAGGRDIYVSTNGPDGGDPVFGTWGTASSNIQWAVSVATNNDMVWISNGVYVLTNQVTVISNITISGLSADDRPVVDGNHSNRCFYFNTNLTCTVANLFITGGRTNDNGGGIYLARGTVSNCVFSNNVCGTNGGGLYVAPFSSGTCTVRYCTFISNTAANGSGYGLTHILGNYRLSLPNSPCVNTGTNYSWQSSAGDARSKDLDGRNRIRYGTVDMGAYEKIYDGTSYSVR